MDFELRALQSGDRVSGFSMGDAAFTPLKTFLQRQAKAFEANSLARTYAIFEVGGTSIKAYITVTCGEIELGNEVKLDHQQPINYPYKHYPAVKIGRLAVSQALRGQQVGSKLVNFALGIAKEYICPNVGCRFAVVDSKKNSVPFYEKCGFTFLDTPKNRELDNPVMFMDLSKI
jgi:GNAT superfamily N-acetyltransferase